MSALDKLSALERRLLLNSLSTEEAEQGAVLVIQARKVAKEISEDAMLGPTFSAVLMSDLASESGKAATFSFFGTLLHGRHMMAPESAQAMEMELRRGYILDGMLRQAVVSIERLAKTV